MALWRVRLEAWWGSRGGAGRESWQSHPSQEWGGGGGCQNHQEEESHSLPLPTPSTSLWSQLKFPTCPWIGHVPSAHSLLCLYIFVHDSLTLSRLMMLQDPAPGESPLRNYLQIGRHSFFFASIALCARLYHDPHLLFCDDLFHACHFY